MYLCAGDTYLSAPGDQAHHAPHQSIRRPGCAPGDQVTHHPIRRTKLLIRQPCAPGCSSGDQAHQDPHQATRRTSVFIRRPGAPGYSLGDLENCWIEIVILEFPYVLWNFHPTLRHALRYCNETWLYKWNFHKRDGISIFGCQNIAQSIKRYIYSNTRSTQFSILDLIKYN